MRKINIKILNVLGQIVYEENLTRGLHQLFIKDWQSGIYVLQTQEGVVKFMKY
ncbi:MAG: hypothetical protein RIS64_4311 [Bacteroidota bacterium]|jgi:hypothetical protein